MCAVLETELMKLVYLKYRYYQTQQFLKTCYVQVCWTLKKFDPIYAGHK